MEGCKDCGIANTPETEFMGDYCMECYEANEYAAVMDADEAKYGDHDHSMDA